MGEAALLGRLTPEGGESASGEAGFRREGLREDVEWEQTELLRQLDREVAEVDEI